MSSDRPPDSEDGPIYALPVERYEISDWIADAVAEHMRKAGEAREQACEDAIQSGVYGVMETWTRGNDGVSLGTVTFELSDKVPYGRLHVRLADEPWRPL